MGCYKIGEKIGKRASIRTLETAFDHGITYFDTAPPYGYGNSERLVGEFIK